MRDRIDIHHSVPSVTPAEMYQDIGASGTTAAVAARVLDARERQRARFAGMPWLTNSGVPGYEFRRRCALSADASRPLQTEMVNGRLTQRGADRVVRMAWTVADLRRRDRPDEECVREALALRSDGVSGESARRGRVS